MTCHVTVKTSCCKNHFFYSVWNRKGAQPGLPPVHCDMQVMGLRLAMNSRGSISNNNDLKPDHDELGSVELIPIELVEHEIINVSTQLPKHIILFIIWIHLVFVKYSTLISTKFSCLNDRITWIILYYIAHVSDEYETLIYK